MLPSPAEIAERDARRLARVLAEVGGEGAALDGGWMACDPRGSWATYAAGLGVDGPVSDATLDALVAYYAARGRRAAIQITPYQHPSLLDGLAARGFTVYELESVLARALTPRPAGVAVPGLRFQPVDPDDDDSVANFVAAQLAGFFPDRAPPPAMIPITERVARSSRCRLWLMTVDGELAGSGGLEVFEDAAVLIAGAVMPHFRRRGIQQAFVRFRLEQARLDGRAYATVGSTPGGPTERNALRAGFQMAYTQIGLARPAPR